MRSRVFYTNLSIIGTAWRAPDEAGRLFSRFRINYSGTKMSANRLNLEGEVIKSQRSTVMLAIGDGASASSWVSWLVEGNDGGSKVINQCSWLLTLRLGSRELLF